MWGAPDELVLGLITGVAFGFLLQKGRVAKHNVIVGQLLLRDFTVAKIMLTAVAVGALGFWSLVAIGVTPVEVKPAEMGGVLFGALLFGMGLAALGYCPGTTVAAVGEGRRDALAGLAGMLVGAFVFVRGFPTLGELQKRFADLGRTTWPDLTRTPTLLWVLGLGVLALASYMAAKRRQKKPLR